MHECTVCGSECDCSGEMVWKNIDQPGVIGCVHCVDSPDPPRSLTRDAPVRSGAIDDMPYVKPKCQCGHAIEVHRNFWIADKKHTVLGYCLEKCKCDGFRPRNGR